jgi:hypothetical protein
MKTGKIYSTPPQNNKPGYIIYTKGNSSSPKQSAAARITNEPDDENKDRYILYWPYDSSGNLYTFQKNDVVQFEIKEMILRRGEFEFKIDVAANLSLLKKVSLKK